MLSPAPASSSHPSSYDIPEHPPPTTRMRRPDSGLPSSRRRSETFLAAVWVSVIMREPPVTPPGSNTPVDCTLSQNTPGGQEGQLLERGARGQGGHQHDRRRDLLGPEHLRPVGGAGGRVPDRRVDGARQEDADPDPGPPQLLGEHAAPGDDPC